MQKDNFIKGLKQMLLSLTDDELREVMDSNMRNRIENFWIKPAQTSIETKDEAKANIFDRLTNLGIDRFHDAKESISDTMSKIDFSKKKDKVQKKTEIENDASQTIVHNNPFQKIEQNKQSNLK